MEKLVISFFNVYPVVNNDYRSVVYGFLLVLFLWRLIHLCRELPIFHIPTLGVAIATTSAGLLLTCYQAYLALFAKELFPYVTLMLVILIPRLTKNVVRFLLRNLVNIDLSKAQSSRELHRVLLLSNLIRYYTPMITANVKRSVQQSRESTEDWGLQMASESQTSTGQANTVFSGESTESKALIDLISVVSGHCLRVTAVNIRTYFSSER